MNRTAKPGPRGSGGWRDDRGALTLSYVAVLPFVFLLLMVLIQTSFWFLARNAALAAARQGADAARALNASRASGPAAALAFAREAGQGYLEDPRATTTGSTSATISITVSGPRSQLCAGTCRQCVRDGAGAG